MRRHATPVDAPVPFQRRARYVVGLITVVVVGLALLWLTRQAVLLVFLGVSLGVLFYRLSVWLHGHTHVPRGVALAAVVLTVLAAVGAAGYFGGPQLAGEARALVEQAPEVIATAQSQLGIPVDAVQLPSGLGQIAGRALGVFSSVFGAFAGVLVVLLVAIYTAASPGVYVRAATRLFDRDRQPFVRHVLGRCGEILMAWMKGVGISFLALTTMAVVGLTVLELPGALALATFAGILTIIPNFGPFIGWAPAVAVGFSQGTTTGLYTLGLAVVAQQVEGSFITPKIQGDMVKVGAAIIVAGQIALGALTGFLGVLLVVPVLGVARILIEELYIGPIVDGEPADPDAAPPSAGDGLPEPDEHTPDGRPPEARPADASFS